jgi:hypothetical protein
MQVFVEKSVEDVGVERLSILRYVRDLIEEASVHDDEIRAHLVESADVFW